MPLDQGIIDTQNVPRLTSLVRSILLPSPLDNPYLGVGTLASLVTDRPAYGLKWSLQSAPASAGRSVRAVTTFEVPWLSLAMHYVFADGSDFIGDQLLTGVGEGFVLFELGQPTSIAYDITPGWITNFAWLVAP